MSREMLAARSRLDLIFVQPVRQLRADVLAVAIAEALGGGWRAESPKGQGDGAWRAWLIDGVTRSTATFKIIFTSVPLDFGIGIDHWAAFTTERNQLFDAFAGVPGVLFVSGDQHWFAAHQHARGIREFQVGPLARGVIEPGRMAQGGTYCGNAVGAAAAAATLDVLEHTDALEQIQQRGTRLMQGLFETLR